MVKRSLSHERINQLYRQSAFNFSVYTLKNQVCTPLKYMGLYYLPVFSGSQSFHLLLFHRHTQLYIQFCLVWWILLGFDDQLVGVSICSQTIVVMKLDENDYLDFSYLTKSDKLTNSAYKFFFLSKINPAIKTQINYVH